MIAKFAGHGVRGRHTYIAAIGVYLCSMHMPIHVLFSQRSMSPGALFHTQAAHVASIAGSKPCLQASWETIRTMAPRAALMAPLPRPQR